MSRYHGTRQRRAFDVWQIVYIDLMTNVMIFFVVLWAGTAAVKKKSSGVSDTFGTETVKTVDLPGDVLFSVGKSDVSDSGHQVFQKLFSDGQTLDFDTGGLTKRVLVIHGHTDNDGKKDKNFELGFQRALATYREIAQYGGGVPDHVVLCSHADNTPAEEVPAYGGNLTPAEQAAIDEAKAKNRRIVIEDKLVSRQPPVAP